MNLECTHLDEIKDVTPCADTIGEVADVAEDGLDRISSDAALCFACLRQTGLRL